ncbi:MAG: hypothetical protein ABSD98_04655 [Candidatus Korobacteraceae bacterium]|jgi:outer membrane biogenesis lipoprotein LolB
MKKLKATLSLAGLALLLLRACPTMLAQQPPDNVAGNWTIYSTSIQNGETVVQHVQIGQYGNRLTGYFEGQIAHHQSVLIHLPWQSTNSHP